MDKNTYIVKIGGCDDHTTFRIDADEKELGFLLKVAELSQKTSTYGCMPSMYIYHNRELEIDSWNEDDTEQERLHAEYEFGKEIRKIDRL